MSKHNIWTQEGEEWEAQMFFCVTADVDIFYTQAQLLYLSLPLLLLCS